MEVHYESRLASNDVVVDSSFTRGTGAPFAFQLGNGDVPKAMELGAFDMCVGEQRRIVAPPRLAYGVQGSKVYAVPPNSTVIFDISMEAINFQTDPTLRREDTPMAVTPWDLDGKAPF